MLKIPGNKLVGWSLWSVFGMNHEKHVWKTSSEVSAIGVMMFGGFWHVNIKTFWTIQFNHGFAWYIRKTNGQHWLIFAIDTWTKAEIAVLILFKLLKLK